MAKSRPGYPDYVKTVRRRGKVYEYFDTGTNATGKRVYRRLPDKTDRSYGGTYAALLAARVRREKVGSDRTMIELNREYQHSKAFKDRSEGTKKTYGIYLARIEKEFHDAPIIEVERKDVQLIMDKMQATPGAANMLLTVVRQLFKYAIAREYVQTDPSKNVLMYEKDDDEGHEPWPEHLLAAALVEPLVRLPVALLYYTAQRIGDVCQMRWDAIKDGYITVVQEKTGKPLDIPLHVNLARMLADTPHNGDTIMCDPKGKPVKVPTLRTKLQAFAAALGHHVVPHGLRKNAVNTLLEAGCSIGETSAVSGQTLAMVERYARRRNNRKMATSAISRWEEHSGTIENSGKQHEKH